MDNTPSPAASPPVPSGHTATHSPRPGCTAAHEEPLQPPESPCFAFPYPCPGTAVAVPPRSPTAARSPIPTRVVTEASSVLARSHSPSAHRLGHHQHQQQPQLQQQQRWPRDHVYRRKADGRTEKLVLVLVGLPARGKSYIAHKLVNYLNWTGRRARLFNVGAFRRLASSSSPAADSSPEAAATGADGGGDGASSTAKSGMRHDSEFFSHANARARALRDELAFTVLQELCQWLDSEGDVAVFDATNTTKERRRGVLERCRAHSRKINVIFIESICDDRQVLESNFLQKIRNSPDYRNMPEEEAVKDLRARISNYEAVYETVEDDEQLSYIKLINLQSKVICNRIYGKIAQKIVGFLMAIHTGDRPIWLTRSGHCDEVEDLDPLQDGSEETAAAGDEASEAAPARSGRARLESSAMPLSSGSKRQAKFPSIASMTAHLSPAGLDFSRRLSEFIADYTQKKCAGCRVEEGQCPVLVYTSTLPRALETVRTLSVPPHCVERSSSLKMINTGVCSGMSVQEMMEKMPNEWAAWRADPFRYRFAGGESYKDVVQNVEPLVLDLERQTTPILVVSHLSTLQVLFGYFVGCPVDSFATLSLPRHTVVQLTPNQYGWKVDLIPLHGLDGSASPAAADHQQRYQQQQQHPFYGRTDASDSSAKREHDAPRATAEGEGSLV